MSHCQIRIYTEGSKNHLSPNSLRSLVNNYVPMGILQKIGTRPIRLNETFHGDENIERHLKTFFDNSNGHFRVYGSVSDLAGNILIYRNVPGNHQLFDFDKSEGYSNIPMAYQNWLKDSWYMCKQDVYVHLLNMVLEHKKYTEFRDMFLCSVITLFLKINEEKLDSFHEYVKVNSEEFESIETDFDAKMKEKMGNLSPNSQLILVKFTFEEILSQFKNLLSISISQNAQELARTLEFLQTFMKNSNPQKHPEKYKKMYTLCFNVIETLTEIIEKRPMLFKKNSELECPSKVIRAFQDRNRTFVMVDELFEAIGEGFGDKYTSFLDTKEISEAMKSISEKKKSGEVDFIYVPIPRSKHRASIIRNRLGHPFKLSIDVFIELLFEWVQGYQLFQKIRTDKDWERVNIFLSRYSFYFDPNDVNIGFVQQEILKLMPVKFEAFCAELISRPARDIRSNTGFTGKDLKDELKYLGLERVFPEIMGYTKQVYAHVLKTKKSIVLRTVDLFDAIYQCQLIAFFKKFEKWAKFLHNQNGCHRVVVTDCCSLEGTSQLQNIRI